MTEKYEVAIIGAGPAGITAACSAAANNVSHILFERNEIGNTVFDYQLRKFVMAEPAKLPLRGPVKFQAGSREQVLQNWNEAISENSINLIKAEVSHIKKIDDGFEITASGELYQSKYVILAIGVQGSPRTLGVSGEAMPHVAYTLSDPDAFVGMDVLVVGAGDAAIENALALCEKNNVSILNRSAEFPRAKDANIAKIQEAINNKKIRCFYNSAISRVEENKTFINTSDGEVELKCNHIIARLGCILPRKFLENCGISFPSEDPNSVPVVNSRYESNVPGLYILGALIGYPLIKQAMNQGYEVIEHLLGNAVEPADQVLLQEKLAILPGNTNHNLALIRERLPLFTDLSDPQFRELIIDSTVHVKKRGEIIFERNDYTDSFYSVVSGAVAIQISEQKSYGFSQGNFFGEMGLLSGRRRTATVRAAEDCVLLESPRKQILKLLSSVPSVKKALDEVFMIRALQTSVFPDADPMFLVELTKRAKMRNFKKGEVLFKEGDSASEVYVIRKGSVKISRRNHKGLDIAQTYIPAGNLVGEMALIGADAEVRSATVTAVVPCETILIEKKDFLELLDKNENTKKRILQIAAQRKIENITQVQSEYTGSVLDFMMAEGVTDADNVLIIDSDLCVACDNCEKACAATHGGDSRLDRKGGKNYASIQIPISCRHCENPLCMLDCPPDALTRKSDGEVVIRDTCIGCGNCVRNCPYGVIKLVHEHESHGFSLLGLLGIGRKASTNDAAKAAKCDMCSELSSGPACVRSCPTGAAMRVNPKQLLDILDNKQGIRG
jgi:thioredoxin reductase/CRP-like cAMP-binding protein/Fe-S-cluster-containing hydrogenase component 2